MTMPITRHDFLSSTHESPVRMLPTAPEEETHRHGSEEDSERRGTARPQHWTEVTLYFADGSGLTSRWQRDHAQQAGSATMMSKEAATAEHLRALQELRCLGGSTNWYTNASLDLNQPPKASDIDWSGLPETEH
jgi:hypothetical protein